MDEITEIIMRNNDSLEQKGKLFVDRIEERVDESLDYIKKEYNGYEKLKEAMDYVNYLHTETVKPDFYTLQRVGYYPATEIEIELDHSVKHALIGSYKSAFADLRRALELSITFVYLVLEETDEEKAKNWIRSNHNTIAFTKALKTLVKQGRFKKIESSCGWKKRLQELYIELSGFSHNKGMLKGYRELNKITLFTPGTSVLSIKKETIDTFCDLYIQTIQEIIAIQALYNPIILVGVPLDEKFGLEPPISGFLNDEQARMIKKLIPEKYENFFDHLTKNDSEIKENVECFNALYDLTDEDIKSQAQRQDGMFTKSKTRINQLIEKKHSPFGRLFSKLRWWQ